MASKSASKQVIKPRQIKKPDAQTPTTPKSGMGDENKFESRLWRLFKWVLKQWLVAAGAVTVYSVFYLAGYLKFQGQLNVYGVDYREFPQPTGEYFANAYGAYLELFSNGFHGMSDFLLKILYMAGSIAVIGFVLVIVTNAANSRREKLEAREARRIAEGHGPSWLFRFRAWIWSWEPLWLKVPIAGGLFTAFIWLFAAYVAAVAILFTIWPYQQGVNESLKEKEKYKDCKDLAYVKGEMCEYLFDHGTLVGSGARIVTNESLIALYDGHSVTIYKRDGLTEVVPNPTPSTPAPDSGKASPGK